MGVPYFHLKLIDVTYSVKSDEFSTYFMLYVFTILHVLSLRTEKEVPGKGRTIGL